MRPDKILSGRARLRCCLDVACDIRVGSSGLVGETPTELLDLLVTQLNPASQSCCYDNTLPPFLFCRRFRPIAQDTLPMR
jgi:hypothetical protein